MHRYYGDTGQIRSWKKAVKSQQSKRFLFAFLRYTVTAKRLFVWAGAVGEMYCDMFNSIKWVQNILCRDGERGTACKPSMKSLKPDPWTGPCFSQLFQIGLLYYLHALNIILYESKRNAFFLNKYQLPCEIRFNSNVNGLFGQVLSILSVYICVCVCVTPVVLYLHWGPKPRALLAACRKCC